MKAELKRTTEALARLQVHRTEGLYRDFMNLLTELQEDIRLANDYEPETEQLFRNQGAVRIIDDILKGMRAQPKPDKKPKVYDGSYTDI